MYVIRTLLKSLVLPPANLFLLALIGFACRRRWPRLGRSLIGGAGLGFYVLSTPMMGNLLVRTLETEPPVPAGAEAEAIVVLSGDSSRTPEFGSQTVGGMTLERVRYGAFLHRKTGVPLLVTGGAPRRHPAPVASVMKQTLETEFQVPVRWTETRARNTWQNARFSAGILRPEGVRRIFLVTHAWHMPRSRWCFEAFGFEVIPAPTAFVEPLEPKLGILLPSAHALEQSRNAFHEWIGRLYYWLAYREPDVP